MWNPPTPPLDSAITSSLAHLTDVERLRVLSSYCSRLRNEYGRTPEVMAAERVVDALRARVFRSASMAKACRNFEDLTWAAREALAAVSNNFTETA